MKKDYTPIMRTIEDLIRAYSLPILPTSLMPLTDFVYVGRTKSFNFHVFGNEESFRRYVQYLHWSVQSRERVLRNDPEAEKTAPKDATLNISIEYWRKQFDSPKWLPPQPVSEFRVPEKTTGIHSVQYSFDNNGRYGLVGTDVGHDGSLGRTSLFLDRMTESFREQMIQLFSSHGASIGAYSVVNFEEPFDHVILLKFLLEKLRNGE